MIYVTHDRDHRPTRPEILGGILNVLDVRFGSVLLFADSREVELIE